MPHHPNGSDQVSEPTTVGTAPFDPAPLYAAARAHRSWSRARWRRRGGVALSLVVILGTAVAVVYAFL